MDGIRDRVSVGKWVGLASKRGGDARDTFFRAGKQTRGDGLPAYSRDLGKGWGAATSRWGTGIDVR